MAGQSRRSAKLAARSSSRPSSIIRFNISFADPTGGIQAGVFFSPRPRPTYSDPGTSKVELRPAGLLVSPSCMRSGSRATCPSGVSVRVGPRSAASQRGNVRGTGAIERYSYRVVRGWYRPQAVLERRGGAEATLTSGLTANHNEVYTAEALAIIP